MTSLSVTRTCHLKTCEMIN